MLNEPTTFGRPGRVSLIVLIPFGRRYADRRAQEPEATISA
jgi:hypothetical protein